MKYISGTKRLNIVQCAATLAKYIVIYTHNSTGTLNHLSPLEKNEGQSCCKYNGDPLGSQYEA